MFSATYEASISQAATEGREFYECIFTARSSGFEASRLPHRAQIRTEIAASIPILP